MELEGVEAIAFVVWNVETLPTVEEDFGESFDSPEFVIGEKNKTKWKFSLVPALGPNEESEVYFALYLEKIELDNDSEEVKPNVTYAVRFNEDGINKPIISADDFDKNLFTLYWDWPEPFTLTLSKSVDEKTVQIVSCIKIHEIKRVPKLDPPKLSNKGVTTKRLRKGLWQMQRQKELTDVVIKCEYESICCHKVVLAAGSKVFKAMLTNTDTMEYKTNCISSYFSFQCMEIVLEFLYHGHLLQTLSEDHFEEEMKNIDTMGEFCEAADYYDIPKFKNICEEEMMKLVHFSNVLEVLDTAWQTNCKKLLQKCVEVVKSEGNSIDDKDWKSFLARGSDLEVYLMKQIISPDESESEEQEIEDDLFLDLLWQLYVNQELTDVNIKCGEEVIKCHKVILQNQAPKLYELLKSEPNTNEIIANDFSFECYMKMIEAIYTNKVDKSKITVELLLAAREYGLWSLECKCSETLLTTMNADNAIECLEAGWKTKWPDLQDKALELILSDSRLMDSEKYDNIVLKNHELAREVTKMMSKKINTPLKSVLVYEKP